MRGNLRKDPPRTSRSDKLPSDSQKPRSEQHLSSQVHKGKGEKFRRGNAAVDKKFLRTAVQKIMYFLTLLPPPPPSLAFQPVTFEPATSSPQLLEVQRRCRKSRATAFLFEPKGGAQVNCFDSF